MNVDGWTALLPEAILSLAALGILLGEAFLAGRDRLWLKLAAAATGLAAASAFACGGGGVTAFGMAAADPLASLMKLLLLGGVFIVFLLSLDFKGFEGRPMGLYATVLLLTAVGLLLLVSATDLILIVIALELLGIGSFVMTGFLPRERRSSEAAIKFFLVGSLSTALLLFGASFYYGFFGTTDIQALLSLRGSPPFPLVLALILMLAGFGFKLAMVPFHMWVPDAYEGAPTPVTAFLSVAPKAAALGVLLRFLPRHAELGLTPLLAVLAALTMTVGNLGAIWQTNVKRLLAYSSIAQVGYILIGFVAAGPLGFSGAVVYVAAYIFMNLGAFACVIAVSNAQGSDELSAFDGLAGKSLGLSLALAAFLLSLTGLPPLFGFVGKFTLFASAISQGWLWLAVVAVLNSVISLYYYFRIAHRAFFSPPLGASRVNLPAGLAGGLALCLLATVGLGLAPESFLSLTRAVFP